MGFVKYQKGSIEAIERSPEDGADDKVAKPKNGQHQDIICPHDLPVNSCKVCMGKRRDTQTDYDVDDRSED